MAERTYRVVRVDELLWALGGFGEPEEHRIDRRRRLLRKYREKGLTYTVIAHLLGCRPGDLLVDAHKIGITKPREKCARDIPLSIAIGDASEQRRIFRRAKAHRSAEVRHG